MNFARYLREDSVDLAFDPELPELREGANPERHRQKCKEIIIASMAELLCRSNRIVNPSKLRTDLIHRERRASTGIGENLAMPHVRTAQARDFTIAFARCATGLDFDSLDGEPVYFLLALVAPPHDDRLYTKVYKRVAKVFKNPTLRHELRNAQHPGEVTRILNRHF